MLVIDILVPMSPQRFLPQIVVDSWLIQQIPFRLFMSNVIGDSAINAREAVKQMWQASEPSAPYVLMTDNDIILNEGSLDVMIKFLEDNEDFAGIGLQRGKVPDGELTEAIEPQHISAGPILYRPEIYKQISYHDVNEGCDCIRAATAIRNLGHRIGFLCGASYQHIEDTNR